jgi:hypothetical protein
LRKEGRQLRIPAIFRLVLPIFLLASAPPAPAGTQTPDLSPCKAYSDAFDFYNPQRWHEVLLYSKVKGRVSVEDGWMVLKAPGEKPVEVEVYSLFTFEGDFDLQLDYDLSDPTRLETCRFNAGMVLQTSGDRVSYKFYIATRERRELFYRVRMDRFGEHNVEMEKHPQASEKGTIRLIRRDGRIQCHLLRDDAGWEQIHVFESPNREALRLRLKLQTYREDETRQPCGAKVKFDNFIVNSCDRIHPD